MLGAGNYLLGKGENGESGAVEWPGRGYDKTRNRLPEKVVLSVAKILESARPFVEFQEFTRQRQKCCWKFAKRRYNG